MENVTKAPLVIYTIVDREREGRKFWVRIGTAFRNQDGSLNARLDAVPVNGTLHIREPRAFGKYAAANAPGEAEFVEAFPR